MSYYSRKIDGVETQLNVILDSLTAEAIGVKPTWVKCPICTKENVVPVVGGRRLQSTKCRNCSSEMKVIVYPDKTYKIKCDIGVIEIDRKGHRWTQKFV